LFGNKKEKIEMNGAYVANTPLTNTSDRLGDVVFGDLGNAL